MSYLTFKELVKRGELYVHNTSGDMVVAFPIVDVHKRTIRREASGMSEIETTMELHGNASRKDSFYLSVSCFGKHLGLDRVVAHTGSVLYFKLNDHKKEVGSLHESIPLTFPSSIFKEKFRLYGTERPKQTTSRIF